MVGIGTRVWVYGGLASNATDANGDFITYPTANYAVGPGICESPPVVLLDKTLT
jgi:hypothetical protein